MSSLVRACRAMTMQEKFLFDLNGFIILRNVLTTDEVSAMNSAIDAHSDSIKARDIAPLKNTLAGSALSAKESRRDLGGVLLKSPFIWFNISRSF